METLNKHVGWNKLVRTFVPNLNTIATCIGGITRFTDFTQIPGKVSTCIVVTRLIYCPQISCKVSTCLFIEKIYTSIWALDFEGKQEQKCWKTYTSTWAFNFDGKWEQNCWKIYTSIGALDFDGKWEQKCGKVYASTPNDNLRSH